MSPRLARALWLAPTLLAVCPSAPLTAQTIDTIIVVRHNVYDRKRDAPKVVASVGNALHITTLGWVVRHALLIKRGDTYDSAKVAESERALRALTIFRAVSIDTERVDGGRLALRVETDDAWSTIPDFDYSSVAGDVLWAVAFTEGNLLGSGTALTGRYEKTPDRHSVSVGYGSTGLLGRRTALAAQYKAISDGDSGSWSLGVPFYETVAPRSLVTYGAAGKERVLRFRDDTLADSMQHRLLRLGVWAAPRAWGYKPDSAGVGAEASGQLSAIWHNGFAVLRGQADGVFTGAGVDSGRVFGGMTVASQNLARQTLVFHLEGGALRRPKPGDEFDLWRDSKGPRLFGAHAFTGTREAWVALEDRFVVKDEVWGLFGVGLAPYFDYGGAWDATEPTRLGGDAGLALRLGPTRLTITDVGQFAFGYRWGKGFTGRHWAFTATGNILY